MFRLAMAGPPLRAGPTHGNARFSMGRALGITGPLDVRADSPWIGRAGTGSSVNRCVPRSGRAILDTPAISDNFAVLLPLVFDESRGKHPQGRGSHNPFRTRILSIPPARDHEPRVQTNRGLLPVTTAIYPILIRPVNPTGRPVMVPFRRTRRDDLKFGRFPGRKFFVKSAEFVSTSSTGFPHPAKMRDRRGRLSHIQGQGAISPSVTSLPISPSPRWFTQLTGSSILE
jgi:hypothetical protein